MKQGAGSVSVRNAPNQQQQQQQRVQHNNTHRRLPWPVTSRPLISLDRILYDAHTVPHLLDFFGKRHSGQLLFCWMEMEQFKEIPEELTELLLAQGRKIFYKYMDPKSGADVDDIDDNITPTSVLAKLLNPAAAEQLESHADSVLYQLERGCPDRKLFGLCQQIIRREIKDVHYAEFLKSASFRALVNNLKATGDMPLEAMWSSSRSSSLLEAFAVSSCPIELANVLLWIDLERVLYGLSVLWETRSNSGPSDGGLQHDDRRADGPFVALEDLKRCYLDDTRTHGRASAVSDVQRIETVVALEKAMDAESSVGGGNDETMRVAVSKLDALRDALVEHMQAHVFPDFKTSAFFSVMKSRRSSLDGPPIHSTHNVRRGVGERGDSYRWYPTLRAAGVAHQLVLADLLVTSSSSSSSFHSQPNNNSKQSSRPPALSISSPRHHSNTNDVLSGASVIIALRIGVREMEPYESSSYGALYGLTPNGVGMTSVIIDQSVVDDALPDTSTPPPKPPKPPTPTVHKGKKHTHDLGVPEVAVGAGGVTTTNVTSPAKAYMHNLHDSIEQLLPVVMSPISGAKFKRNSQKMYKQEPEQQQPQHQRAKPSEFTKSMMVHRLSFLHAHAFPSGLALYPQQENTNDKEDVGTGEKQVAEMHCFSVADGPHLVPFYGVCLTVYRPRLVKKQTNVNMSSSPENDHLRGGGGTLQLVHVQLEKDPHLGLGMNLGSLNMSIPKVVLSRFVNHADGRAGPAALSGLLRIGDRLESVNSIPTANRQFRDVVTQIKSAQGPVSFMFSRRASQPLDETDTDNDEEDEEGGGGHSSASLTPLSRSSSHTAATAMDSDVVVMAPDCLVVVSRQPCFSDLVALLTDVYTKETPWSQLALFKLTGSFPAKPPTELTASIPRPLHSMNILMASPPCLPMHQLFRSLSVAHVCDVVAALMQEHSVVLCSDELSILPLITHALCSLMHPFRWQHVVVSSVPQDHWDMWVNELSFCPQPFIMGICTRDLCLPEEQQASAALDDWIGSFPSERIECLSGLSHFADGETVIVDLDGDTVELFNVSRAMTAEATSNTTSLSAPHSASGPPGQQQNNSDYSINGNSSSSSPLTNELTLSISSGGGGGNGERSSIYSPGQQQQRGSSTNNSSNNNNNNQGGRSLFLSSIINAGSKHTQPTTTTTTASGGLLGPGIAEVSTTAPILIGLPETTSRALQIQLRKILFGVSCGGGSAISTGLDEQKEARDMDDQVMFERVSTTFHKYLSSLVSVDGNFCTVLGRTPHDGCIPSNVAKVAGKQTHRGSQAEQKRRVSQAGINGRKANQPPNVNTSRAAAVDDVDDECYSGVGSSEALSGEEATVMLALNADAYVEAAVETDRPFLRRFVRTSAFADWLVRHAVPY